MNKRNSALGLRQVWATRLLVREAFNVRNSCLRARGLRHEWQRVSEHETNERIA